MLHKRCSRVILSHWLETPNLVIHAFGTVPDETHNAYQVLVKVSMIDASNSHLQ